MKELFSDFKKGSKLESSYACRLCVVGFKISVVDFGGKKQISNSTENLFKIPERAGVDKFLLEDLMKIHLGVELDPQNGKSSRERETISFCSRFYTIPPRQDADR